MDTEDHFARIAYQAYGKTTDFKNFQGNPMPEWDDLPEAIRRAWMAAAEAVREETLYREEKSLLAGRIG